MNGRAVTRIAAALVLGSMLGVFLVACADPAESNERTISVVLADNPWQRAIAAYIPEFEEQTGIEVSVQVLGEQQARDRVLITLQGESPAMDVFMTIPSREGAQFAAEGWYLPLEERLTESPEWRVEDVDSRAMDAMVISGQTIALPVNLEATVLYYRTDVLEELGMSPPATWAEMETVAASIETETDLIPFASRGTPDSLSFTFSTFLHSAGGEWTSGTGEPSIDTGPGIDAISTYARLLRDYGPPGVVGNGFTQNSLLMAQGLLAMNLESSNELTSIAGSSSIVQDKIGVASVPAGAGGSRPTIVSWALAISSFSSNADEAWQFLVWATGPEMQRILAEDGVAPPRSSILDSSDYLAGLDDLLQQSWSRTLAEALRTGSTEVGPVGTQGPAMRRVIGDHVNAVILQILTPEEAAVELQAELELMLADDR